VARNLTVRLAEDRPGALAELVETLSRAGVNIEGITEVQGTVHFLVKNPPPARTALRGAGYQLEDEKEVVVIPMTDRPGELTMVVRDLAEAGVNVNFLYLATGTRIVIGTDDVVKARQVLADRSPASHN
jgi:hypothetical protein